MKTSIKLLLLIALTAISQRCTEDPEPVRQQISIGFFIPSHLPPGSSLVLSIETQSGEPVMEQADVEFQRSGESFITSPLPFPTGNYRITDFMIVNENDEIIFATPKKSSPLGSAMSGVPDLNFRVPANQRAFDHDVQLLTTRNHKPADFGYKDFKLSRRIANILVTVEGSHRPVSAWAAFLDGPDTVSTWALKARMNRLPLPASSDESDSLVIWKDGYAPERYSTLQLEQNAPRPLRVILEPAFTMLAFIDPLASLTFMVDMAGTEGSSITVDWGDGGTPQVYALGPDFTLMHDYPGGGTYPVTITGDIDQITYFYSAYGQGMFQEINFRHLTGLTQIRIALTTSPDVLDLSQNTKLETVILVVNLDALVLPPTHYIDFLTLVGPSEMSTEAVDAVIRNIYENTVERSIMNGWIWLAADWTQDEADESILGPPSPGSIELLRHLKETYGWTLSPDPFD